MMASSMKKNEAMKQENDTQESDKRHLCSLCGARFNRPSRVLAHLTRHTGERPFKCKICGTSYTRAQYLKRHMKTHDDQYLESIKVKCSKCKEVFANQTCLDKHFIKFHDLELSRRKRFKCPEEGCNEVFLRKKHLVQHGLTHSKSLTAAMKHYICPHDGCGRKFNYPGRLKVHMKIHDGYKCDHEGCDAVLPDHNALRSHKSTAHPLYFNCGLCGKSFKRKAGLAHHMSVHDGSYVTYSCPWEGCSRTFMHAKNVKLHIRQNHKGEDIWNKYDRKSKPKSSTKEKNTKENVRKRRTLAERLCGINASSQNNQRNSRIQDHEEPRVDEKEIVNEVNNLTYTLLQNQLNSMIQDPCIAFEREIVNDANNLTHMLLQNQQNSLIKDCEKPCKDKEEIVNEASNLTNRPTLLQVIENP